MQGSNPAEPYGAFVTVDFVRHRNALVVRSDLSQLYTDYYLHLADHDLHYTPEKSTVFKDALAAFTLHCASRPLNEHNAWTLNLQKPLLNVFLAGDNEDCTVTGRLFTENVREAPQNIFYHDSIARRGAETRRSVVNFHGADILAAARTYYATSEQRPVRYFHMGDDEFALLVAHPDCDLVWFNSVEVAGIRALGQSETLARIEQRLYRWHCGCTHQKILGAIAPAFRADPEGIFGTGESIRVQCPRCAAAYHLTREAMEAYLAHTQKGGA
jgi:molecular chaperone Hsp33